jgi:hypothetical protein
MELPLTRKALADAQTELAQLAAVRGDEDMFPLRFRSAITMARRVGSILDGEVKGHRSRDFDAFWKASVEDHLHRFVVETRNAELKRGETTIRVGLVAGLRPGRKGTRYSIAVRKQAIQFRRRRPMVPTRKQAWIFAAGQHEGEEVVPLVERYLSWLARTVIPTAEQLTT